MRVSFIRFAAAALTALVLTACSDAADEKGLLAPSARPEKVVIPIRPRGNVIDITSGAEHVCAKTRSNTVYCWGNNQLGQVGVPNTPPASSTCGQTGFELAACVPHPVQVTGATWSTRIPMVFSTAEKLSAGTYHTCAISAGTAWCWGNNANGQIGAGTISPTVITPNVVAGGPFTGISAGSAATCGTSGTNLYCWGLIGGRSGTSPYLYSWLSGWSDNINLGGGHACAQNNQGVWSCWGENYTGQLGLNPAVWPTMDGPIDNPAYAGATNVVAGNAYTCIDAWNNNVLNGTVQCLGSNGNGQLGDPSFIGMWTSNPVTVGGGAGRQLSHVALGRQHACALDPQGAAFCWGSDPFGELGRGTGVSGGQINAPVPVAGGLAFLKLVAGNYHTCGLTVDNRVFCWGSNYFGQLGYLNQSPPAPNPQPVQVVF